MFEPKYKLSQKVKVQVFHTITTGVVIKREFHETNLGVQIRYQVDFGRDVITPWEQDLDHVQGLPLGEIK